jgi:ABC-type sugar transport system ATPase subunit
VGIVYISHRLEEIARIADRLTVLRDGQVVYSGPVGEIELPEIVAKMVGRKIGEHYPPRTSRLDDEILAVKPPSSASNGRSLSVRAGEVVGLAGLVGAGRTEWAWRLVGASPSLPGEKVRLKGREVRITSPTQARSLGLGLVPESRKEHGLILSCSVRDNIVVTILDRLSNFLGFVDRKARSALSGGNQQKVVLAKWLAREGHIIVLDEPTRGIDVGAKVEMYHLINQLSLEGKGVILISSDMPELLSLSDRIYVMRQGRFVAELESGQTSQEEILAFASGFKAAQTV